MDQIEESGQAVDFGELTGQGGGEVEAEAVDVHLRDPIAQRIHDELQDLRGTHQEGVARARRIEVVLTVPVDKAVVRGVVDAAERQGRSHVVALGRVVVDDIEDDLDVGSVQRLDHCLELRDLRARFLRRRVAIVRGKITDRVVAPVVRQPLRLQGRVVRELLDRHELDCGDAELLQVLNDGRMCHAGVRSSQILRDLGMAHSHALNVGLVDDRLRVIVAGAMVALPVEEGVDDDGMHRGVG